MTFLVGLPVAEAAGRFAARLVEQRAAQVPDTDLSDLLRRMAGEAELVRVEQLVQLSGISKRTLQRRFSAALGVSPKWMLARFRLQEAALAIEREPATDLTELALRLGWYDQAHLTNHFRRMLGETPGRYAARAR
jgi:transcriptional regulator GlxA family with amidase domain